ncbi:hypothetical protein HOK021_55840 [Streptomyces hygroscopicus]|nr:hypothetical protein HOK021_55840 [Streptomyces hygroscopicus]
MDVTVVSRTVGETTVRECQASAAKEQVRRVSWGQGRGERSYPQAFRLRRVRE